MLLLLTNVVSATCSAEKRCSYCGADLVKKVNKKAVFEWVIITRWQPATLYIVRYTYTDQAAKFKIKAMRFIFPSGNYHTKFFFHLLKLVLSSYILFFGANTDKSVLQGGPPEVTLSGTTVLHPDWGCHDHHMPDLVIRRITRCH